MRRLFLSMIAAAVLMAASVAGQQAAIEDQVDLTGAWTGTLSLSGPKLRLVFNLERAPDGTYGATMDSPDQGARGIPAGEVSFTGDSLFIEVPMAAGNYSAAYDSESDRFDGVWRQSGYVIPLILSRDGEEADKGRPQDPVRPYPYREIEVTVDVPAAGITLAGTLTLPEGEGPHPAVVLISGSGPQDRNEEVLGHRPFLVLADHLTRKGIAVLRYDDRGVGGSTGDHASATSVDFAGDASAALDHLRKIPGVDPSTTGVIGHSEGALIATMLASRPDSPAFAVLLGGTGLDGSDILLMQTELICLAAGFGEELTGKVMEQKRLEHAILLSEPDPARA
ncbi:MAG TPA: alpha/beta fold hydrolase, partial [Candidatus Krumholzibacterium sp.]|nr:alpha/beta fold hydrolase [Candidatus Krumholzibacterium sp.]